ncbi:MAG: type III-B CRISPR module RAMP protein Cmr6 [Chloroherpetonaceae bacterium]|nr:type III-B CRISPR module RAMP protein Cmr6 [Chloroherpetonaceae bacterium]
MKEYIVEYRKRLEAQLNSLKEQGYVTEQLRLKTDSRLIVGLGAKGALEVGITLHHLYGFPYIPSSAVKGICRAFAEQIADAKAEERKQIFGSESKDEKRDSEKQLGAVVFLDAIPTEPKLEKDIMNPHYSPYYSEKKIPGDWHNPMPIFFLAVPAGTEFWFGLAANSNENLQKAKEWLMGGLSELGAGAKTSSGYGFFKAGKTNQENAVNQATQQNIKPADVTAPAKKPNTKPQGAVEATVVSTESPKAKVKILEGKYKDAIAELNMPINNLKNLGIEIGTEIYVSIIEQNKKIQSVQFKSLKY